MFVQAIIRYILGYVVLKAQGPGVEKLFNLAVSRGIILWDVQTLGERAVFKTYPDNFPLLRPLCRKVGLSLRIERKVGFPFLFYRFKKRRGLVVGLVAFVFILYSLSNFVWFIEVKGNDIIDEEVILESARDLGVTPGVFKRNLDFSYLEKELLLASRDLTWVALHVQGTQLVIEVKEKVRPPEGMKDDPSDLVAAQDGVIEKVLVLSGEARVEPGDTVYEGQVLISGTLTTQEEDEEGKELITREVGVVRARGEVWAKTWYEFFATYNLQETVRERTGESSSAYTLRMGEREIRMGKSTSPYRNYERETIKRNLKWRNIEIPIELITIYYYELDLAKKELSRNEALYKAREELFARAAQAIPEDVDVVSQEVEELPKDAGEIHLRLMVETLENIAKEVVYPEKEEEEKEEQN